MEQKNTRRSAYSLSYTCTFGRPLEIRLGHGTTNSSKICPRFILIIDPCRQERIAAECQIGSPCRDGWQLAGRARTAYSVPEPTNAGFNGAMHFICSCIGAITKLVGSLHEGCHGSCSEYWRWRGEGGRREGGISLSRGPWKALSTASSTASCACLSDSNRLPNQIMPYVRQNFLARRMSLCLSPGN